MAHAQHELVFLAEGDGAFSALFSQCQRLFTENVFFGGNGKLDLLGMERMRRGEDDRLYTFVLQCIFVARVTDKAIFPGEISASGVGLCGANDFNFNAGGFEHRRHFAAPPAEAHHCDFYGSRFCHVTP